ncbi:MAG: O-succinylbenzoic acid--CoA ligase [Bacteroidia bacterium]|jgi:O-succinylbenzoic acid--CoA ligase
MILFSGRLKTNTIPPDVPEQLFQVISEWQNTKSIDIETSGSSGAPKRVILAEDLVQWSAFQSKMALNLDYDEHVLICISTDKIGGRMLLIRAMLFNWQVQIQKASANPFLPLVNDHSFTFVSLVPFQLATILADPDSRAKLTRFKTVLIGGAGLSQVLESDVGMFLKTCKTQMFHSYGMTETASHIALRDIRTMPANTFKLLNGVKVKLSKSDCMQFSIPSVRWKVKTKDVGIVNGRIIQFVSRKDEVVNSGGLKLQIQEIRLAIDTILEKGNLLVRFILWKQADDALGEKLVFVGLKCDQQKQVESLVKQHLPRYEVPRIFYWTDDFKRKESGKIDRQKTVASLIEIGR